VWINWPRYPRPLHYRSSPGWAEAHECPRLRQKDGKYGSAEGPETLDAELLQEEEEEAKAKVQAEKAPPRLAMSTDGSRIENQATGYTVVWIWAGIETPWAATRRPTMRSAPL